MYFIVSYKLLAMHLKTRTDKMISNIEGKIGLSSPDDSHSHAHVFYNK